MRVELSAGKSIEMLVDFVISNCLRGMTDEANELEIAREFAISPENAAIARDRTFGGIVRAATRNPLNQPDPNKDPIAWASYIRATKEPLLAAKVYRT